MLVIQAITLTHLIQGSVKVTCYGRFRIQIVHNNIIILWQILMSVNFVFILVTSMLTVRTPLEATNASAEVVTVAMESYVMVS